MTVETPAPWPRWSFVDFRDTVWVPIRDLLAGHDPYDLPAYLQRHPHSQEFPPYAPAILLLGAPVAMLPWPVACAIWGLFLIGAMLCLVVRAADLAGLDLATAWVPLALAFVLLSPVGSQPGSSGQYAIIAAASSVTALITPSPVLASSAAALSLIKPQVGIPLLAILCVQGRWRSAIAASIQAFVVSAPVIALLVWRSGGIGPWLSVLRQNMSLTASSPNTQAARDGSTRIDVVGALDRVALITSGPATAVITLVTAALTLAVARQAWVHLNRAQTTQAAALWWAAIAAAMVAWTPSELYAALVAVPAVLLSARLIFDRARSGAVADPPWAAVPGLMLLIPFVHVHRFDHALRVADYTQPVNAIAVVAAVAAVAVALRKLEPAHPTASGEQR